MSRARDFADLASSADAGGITGKNLIINGAMQVAQRGTSETGVTSGGYLTCDRFAFYVGNQGTFTVTQEADAPDGFANSFKVACTASDASPAAADYIQLQHKLEGQNLKHLKKGTGSALAITLSFYVKASKTGTHIIELFDNDNSRHISAEYTVSSAGTWEQISISFDGDTTGAFDNDNAASLIINWFLGAGSNSTSGTLATSWASYVAANRAVGTQNYASDTSQYFQITGVQLEVGEQATPFEHRSYGDELARCQRYYENSYSYGTVVGTNTSESIVSCDSGISTTATRYFIFSGNNFKVTKRAFPTLTIYSQDGTVNNISKYNNSSAKIAVSSVASESDKSIGNYIVGATGDNTEPYNFHWVADAEL